MTDNLLQRQDQQVIRLTREELQSERVDDLLKRQMSLRGDLTISRDKKKWFYRNWFVFMVAGAVAAFIAWAIIEPYLDDSYYVQGPIQEMNWTEPMPSHFYTGDKTYEVSMSGRGWVEIRGDRIWLLDGIKRIDSHNHTSELNLSSLSIGQEIGMYVQRLDEIGLNENFGRFMVLSPPQPPSQKSLLSLDQIANRSRAGGMLLFPMVAGLVGLAIGAIDGFICRTLRRAFLCGAVGFLIGFIGGFLSEVIAGLVYMPLNHLAMQDMGKGPNGISTFGFLIQMGGRALAWAIAGIAMGLGQGIALRSKRLIGYGLLGGVIGGLLGGLFFDPIDILLLGMDKPSAHWSRVIGLILIGGSVGVMIGIVELLARDAWLRMTEGPLAGKEFLIFKDAMKLGASPRSDIYLFNDEEVAPHHATIREMGDECEIENHAKKNPVMVNSRPVVRARLRHGDRITFGKTSFVFEKRMRG